MRCECSHGCKSEVNYPTITGLLCEPCANGNCLHIDWFLVVFYVLVLGFCAAVWTLVLMLL